MAGSCTTGRNTSGSATFGAGFGTTFAAGTGASGGGGGAIGAGAGAGEGGGAAGVAGAEEACALKWLGLSGTVPHGCSTLPPCTVTGIE